LDTLPLTPSLLSFPPSELAVILSPHIQQKFRIKQVIDGIYRSNALNFRTISTLPKEIKGTLEQNFRFLTVKEKQRQGSQRSWTTKFLFELADGEHIEAVALPNTKKDFTLCLSSQVGCALRCGFCASGHFGLARNLESHEIVSQALHIRKSGFPVSNIVFMGIGEPMLNYENVISAIRAINAPEGMNIGARNITISTAGVPEGILKLADADLQVRLSVSLHFPYDEMRSKHMPVNRIYPLSELIRSLHEYQDKTNKIITLEYILIHGINDNLQVADDLRKLLSGLDYKINLIPYNPVPCFNFKTPSQEKCEKFFKHLLKKGIKATLRYRRGEDIEAACGQLRMKSIDSASCRT
jgi:23S rRNA (adenine2503-C2)-methyltransferase